MAEYTEKRWRCDACSLEMRNSRGGEIMSDEELSRLERTMQLELEAVSDDGISNADYAAEIRSAKQRIAVLAELRAARQRIAQLIAQVERVEQIGDALAKALHGMRGHKTNEMNAALQLWGDYDPAQYEPGEPLPATEGRAEG